MAHCKICKHPKLGELQKAIGERIVPVDELCQKYGVTKMSLSRHNKHAAVSMHRQDAAHRNSKQKQLQRIMSVAADVTRVEYEILEDVPKVLHHYHALDLALVQEARNLWLDAEDPDLKMRAGAYLAHCVKCATNNLQNTIRLKIDNDDKNKTDNTFVMEVKYLTDDTIPQNTDE